MQKIQELFDLTGKTAVVTGAHMDLGLRFRRLWPDRA